MKINKLKICRWILSLEFGDFSKNVCYACERNALKEDFKELEWKPNDGRERKERERRERVCVCVRERETEREKRETRTPVRSEIF
jgi:hypothetical protein